MKHLRLLTTLFFFFLYSSILMAQVNIANTSNADMTLDGYTFEQFNRGFLREVKITVLDRSEVVVAEVVTDSSGHFAVHVPVGKDYILQAEKRAFNLKRQDLVASSYKAGEAMYLKVEMSRQPGYIFEMTLAEKRYGSEEIPVDGVNGARVEIYNNTKNETVLSIDSTKNPSLNYTFEQGNHYTVLIRRKGFYNKRLEAHINIDGCILCFEGAGTVTPGMVDNLTNAAEHRVGTLIANIELERLDTTRNVVLKNIYYDYNSANLRLESKSELEKLANVLQNNPALIVELGSHTDSRGSEEANLQLSKWRAQAAVDYITGLGKVTAARVKAKGYGESRLVNRCADGVPCSDKEHEQNRRTELRIIGFASIDPYATLSLAEIIHEEQIQKMMLNPDALFAQTEYKAPENPTVTTPEKVAEKAVMVPENVEKVEKTVITVEKVTAVEPSESTSVAIEKETVQAVKVTPTMPKAKQTTPVSNKTTTLKPKSDAARTQPVVAIADSKMPVVVASPSSVAPAFEEKIVKVVEKPTVKMEDNPNIKVAETALPKVEQGKADNTPAVVETTKTVVEPAKAKAIITLDLTPLDAQYSGYSVQLLSSETPLAKDAPSMQTVAEQLSSQVFFQKQADNRTAYFVGLFQFWGETESYLSKVKKTFPDAQIVDFFNGKIVK